MIFSVCTNKLTTTIRLSTQSKRHLVARDGHTGTGATATGVDGEVVGVAALATATRVALGVVVGAHVRPLTERSLAQQDRTRLAQTMHDVRIARDDGADEGPAARGGLHLVLTGDVVLDQEGDAVQGTAHGTLLAFGIQRLGNGHGVGVELQHRTGTPESANRTFVRRRATYLV